MFRVIFLCCLTFTILFSKTTDDKIKEQSSNLSKNSSDQQQISKKLEDLADDILKARKRIDELSLQIEAASNKVDELQKTQSDQHNALNELSLQNKELIQNKKELETKIIRLIAEEFAYDILADKDYEENANSIIKTYALDGLNKVLKEEFYKISKDYESTTALINQKQKAITQIKNNLNEYQNKKLELNQLKYKQVEELKKQQQDQDIYKKRLLDLQKQQDELRKTLKELKILSQQEQTKKQQEELKKQQEKQAQALQNVQDADVKKLGSSYTVTASTHFKGKKTISPLKSYTVKQKFGSYTDQVYNIKIYNENVILKSSEKNAPVRAVLNGKVVFAKETTVLGKVVILEHNDDLHTIYANLTSIPNTIKVNARVKQGNIIGRVYEDLAFEVTKKNAHIDPLELIE